jgi:hypothetical protein
MKFAAALMVVACMACGSTAAGPVTSPVASPLGVANLKFTLIDSVGKPFFCDPDFYPIAREGGEQANALAEYPAIQADTEQFAAITAHEHLPMTNLNDDQKLALYRAWKVLRALVLTAGSSDYSFQYITMATGSYQRVVGTISLDGKITITSRAASGPPPCPICLAASTLIDTPHGPVPVTAIRVGTVVWTEDSHGTRVAEPVIETGSTPVPPTHLMVRLLLADGRELLASPGHRTADGRPLGGLAIGDLVDGSTVVGATLMPYAGERTYDLLPAGDTGHYWADGIRLSSTLKPRAKA